MTLKLVGSTSGHTAIEAPASAGSNTLVLPPNNGTAGQVLQTDGNGNLSWVTLPTDTSFPTHLDIWMLTTGKNWSGTNTFTDWARITSQSYGQIGAAMTMNGSGVFTFPTPGIWEIYYQTFVYDGTPNAYSWAWIDKTINDGSNWSSLVEAACSIPDDNQDVYGHSSMLCTFDVTNVSNHKVRFKIANEQGAQIAGSGSGATLKTGAIFKRIGDT